MSFPSEDHSFAAFHKLHFGREQHRVFHHLLCGKTEEDALNEHYDERLLSAYSNGFHASVTADSPAFFTSHTLGHNRDAFLYNDANEMEILKEDNVEEEDNSSLRMPLTEDVIEFFRQGELRREQLQKEKEQEIRQQQQEHMREDRDTLTRGKSIPEVNPCILPARPSIQWYKDTYGASWKKIVATETALNAQYERCCEGGGLKTSPLWPVLPLRL